MTDNKDDIFRPKLGRIRSSGNARAKSYVNQILHRLSGFGNKNLDLANRRFTGARIGRGNDVMRHRRAGGRFGPRYRRVVIKSRIVKLAGARGSGGLAAARAHLRYIQRDGVSKEHEPGQLYDAASDEADSKSFLSRSDGDRHQFRFIVSPEDATELQGLKPFVRDLMQTVETDLGTKLDWVAVDHYNTERPHSHIALRGKDDLGKDLIIARDYIAHGMRRRAGEILTLELGVQTEAELRRKLARQVEQHRFTDIDRSLVRDAGGGQLDVRHDTRPKGERGNEAFRVGRLRVLEKLGLAKENEPGRWQLSPDLESTLRRAGERGDIIKAMHRSLSTAGIDVGAANYSIYDPGDARAQTITGSIIDRGLHDELNGGHYIIVDGADDRIHYVSLDPAQDMEDLPKGAIVEADPAAHGIKPSDRVILEVARDNDGLYSEYLHQAHDPKASAEFVRAHIRRLESLRRSNVVRRFPDGSWEVPEDFHQRIERLTDTRLKYPGRVVAMSFMSLENQVSAIGATWLDKQLMSKEPIALGHSSFGSIVTNALQNRQAFLIEQGFAYQDGATIQYQRNLLKVLRRRELLVSGEKLAKQYGLTYVESQDGERIDGIYRNPIRLASGKLAVIEKSKEFTLVPWRSVLESRRGKTVSGVMKESSISYDLGKKRGVGIG